MSLKVGNHYVKHASYTRDLKSPISNIYGPISWKRHWMVRTGLPFPSSCMMKGCYNKAVHGAHIFIDNGTTHYILPTCKTCNYKFRHGFAKLGAVACPTL